MALIRKTWRKDASDNAIKATMRVLGAGVTAITLQKLPELFTSDNVKQTVKNIAAPLWSGVMVVGDLLLDNQYLRAVCQGGYSFGFLKTAAVIIRGSANYIGLQGIDNESYPRILNGVIPSTPSTRGIMNGTPAPALPYIPPVPTSAQSKFAKVADYAASTANSESQTAANISGVADVVKAQNAAQSML